MFYGTDCDDTDPNVHPFQDEVCDGIDNNCSGSIDDGTTITFFEDMDGDGYGNADSTIEACDLPQGYVTIDGDCDDADAEQYPFAVETCNQEDDNCDGEVDENPINPPTWYYDIDGDGFEVLSSSTMNATLPPVTFQTAQTATIPTPVFTQGPRVLQ